MINHWETRGRFRKRVVLANVPSFWFSFQGNMRMYPRSGLRSGGTSAKTTLLETTLLATPENTHRALKRKVHKGCVLSCTSGASLTAAVIAGDS